jgi:hypothetical protein
MLGSKRSLGGVTVAALAVAMLVGPGSAAATTICVPAFSAACPNSGGNVAKTDVEEAMSFQGADGTADQVLIAPGTYTEDAAAGFEPPSGSKGSIEPGGSDPLTIAGAGPGATILTSNATGNIFLVNLAFNSRAILMRDLTVRIPASFPDGLGAAFQIDGDTLDNVDIVSRNEGSDGVASAVGTGNVFRNGEIRGESGGSVDDALRSDFSGGVLLVEDAKVVGASWALQTTGAGSNLVARRVDVVGARTYGAIVTRGSLTVENSRLTTDAGVGFYVSASADAASLTANHVTVVNVGGTNPALEMEKSSGAADAAMSVSNSILRGFSSGFDVNASAGPGIGHASLTVRYSNLSGTGTSSGVLDVATGNIDVNPLLAADLSLPPGSPSVDAGDPAAGGLATDFLGAARPADGNGDGVARRDQGAFEYQPPAKPPVPVVPAVPPAPDTTAPETAIVKGPGGKLAKGKAKFSFGSSEAGSSFECKLDGRKVARCISPKRYKHLGAGRHNFKVWATDAAGNKDLTPAKRRFTVPS